MIDEIPAHVIEPVIFLQLPKLLDPSDILKMAQADIDSIAEEPDARKFHRQLLQSKLDTLNRSSLLCKLYLENRAAIPHQDVAQQSSERTPSGDRTPAYGSDGLNMNIQREMFAMVPRDTRKHDSFEISEAIAPEASPDEVPANPLEEDLWAAPSFKKSKKKGKKGIALSYVDEPTEPPC